MLEELSAAAQYVLSAGARAAALQPPPGILAPVPDRPESAMLRREEWVAALFSTIDAKSTRDFLEFLAPDAVFRFGSAPPAEGRVAIGAAVDGFFASIRSLTHRVLDVWSQSDTLISRGEVTYMRLDGRTVVVPFCDVFEMRGEQIARYEIYIDPTPLSTP